MKFCIITEKFIINLLMPINECFASICGVICHPSVKELHL